MSANSTVEIKFYTADWCSQCKMVKKHINGMTYTTVDVDDEEGWAEAESINIKGMPTLVKLIDGQEVDRVVGSNVAKIKELFNE